MKAATTRWTGRKNPPSHSYCCECDMSLRTRVYHRPRHNRPEILERLGPALVHSNLIGQSCLRLSLPIVVFPPTVVLGRQSNDPTGTGVRPGSGGNLRGHKMPAYGAKGFRLFEGSGSKSVIIISSLQSAADLDGLSSAYVTVPTRSNRHPLNYGRGFALRNFPNSSIS